MAARLPGSPRCSGGISRIRGLAPGGILAEPCESGAVCNEDQAQFKGIFVRYLYDFWRPSRQPGYRGFILANPDSAGITPATRIPSPPSAALAP